MRAITPGPHPDRARPPPRRSRRAQSPGTGHGPRPPGPRFTGRHPPPAHHRLHTRPTPTPTTPPGRTRTPARPSPLPWRRSLATRALPRPERPRDTPPIPPIPPITSAAPRPRPQPAPRAPARPTATAGQRPFAARPVPRPGRQGTTADPAGRLGGVTVIRWSSNTRAPLCRAQPAPAPPRPAAPGEGSVPPARQASPRGASQALLADTPATPSTDSRPLVPRRLPHLCVRRNQLPYGR